MWVRGLHGPKFHGPARPDKISARPVFPSTILGPARPVNMWARPGRVPVVASWRWSVVTEKMHRLSVAAQEPLKMYAIVIMSFVGLFTCAVL